MKNYWRPFRCAMVSVYRGVSVDCPPPPRCRAAPSMLSISTAKQLQSFVGLRYFGFSSQHFSMLC